MVREISSQQAWEVLQENPHAALLDVRTKMEYEYVGHPPHAIHIAWVDLPDWNVDPNFASRVQDILVARLPSGQAPEALPILAFCRSGKRSLAAAEELIRQGFTNVYNIEHGFEGDRDNENHRSTVNGWRYENLPWEQS